MSVLSRLDDCGLIARAAVADEEDERDSESLRPHKSAPLLSENDSAHRAGLPNVHVTHTFREWRNSAGARLRRQTAGRTAAKPAAVG